MRILFILFLLFHIIIDAVAQKPVQHFRKKTSYSIINKLSGNSSDSINISIRVNDLADFLRTKNHLVLIKSIQRENILIGRTSITSLKNLLESEHVDFINELLIPKEELTTGAYD